MIHLEHLDTGNTLPAVGNTASRQERLRREQQHAQVLLRNPEDVWGWASPAGRVRARRRARLLTEAGEITPESITLEIGCGTGIFTQLVSESGADITACELCPELIDLARRKSYPSPVRFIREDAAQLKDNHYGRYDVVWGSSVLHHLDLTVFLPHVMKLLKPAGRLVFAEPNMRNPQIWLERNVSWIRRRTGTSPDETAFTRRQIRTLLARYGYENITVRPHEFLHPAVPRTLIPMVQTLGTVMEHLHPLNEIAGSLLIKARKPTD